MDEATFQQLLANKSFDVLAQMCQQEELKLNPISGDGIRNACRLLASYLALHQMENARFLWKRIPDAVKKSNNQIHGLGQLLFFQSKKQYAEFFGILNEHNWNPEMAAIVPALRESTAARNQLLIAKSFSAVDLSTVSTLLGLAPEAALAHVQGLGWNFVAAKSVVIPTRPAPSREQQIQLNQIDQLTDYIVHLERN
eukprot:TRINITY_DN2352_c0_g1_i1.p1 TRINITY_DN2352_c0_g1~~TRINITY_DN2352_c0_g1_i1.p1  ORF type:complete len:218 (+),score=78.41 TRINITY_DN2352_c0_g1_i1:64-654(+)